MTEVIITLIEIGLHYILIAVNYIIFMLKIALGLSLLSISFWAISMVILVPYMTIKSMITTKKD